MAFFKDTPSNRADLGGLVPYKWPKKILTVDLKYGAISSIL